MFNPNLMMNQQQQQGQGQKPQISDNEILTYLQQNPQLLDMLKQNPELASQFGTNLSSAAVASQRPLKSNEYEQIKNIEEYLDKEGGLVIEPTPQFVLKTTEKGKEKIFLNITSHSVIDQPEEKELVDLDDYTGIRVPMSVGRIKEDHDKKKHICKVIDIIINTRVADDLKKDAGLKDFFNELLKNYIFEKYKLELTGQFRTLKMKYKGNSIEYQRVKGKKAPKIEKLNETQAELKKEQEKLEQQAKQNIISQNSLQIPEFECKVKFKDSQEIDFYDGDALEIDVEQIIFEFAMPLLATGKFIRLEIHEKELYLCNKNFYEIVLKIPMKVKTETASAQFFIDQRKLKVIMDVQAIKKDTQSQNQEEETKDIKDYNLEIQNPMLLDLV